MNYKTGDFVEILRAATDGHGIDVTLDMVGGDYTPRNHDLAAVEGRIVQIATLRGARHEINISQLMAKRLTHTGSTLRPRSVAFKEALAAELHEQVWPLIEKGAVAPLIDQTFPLDKAADAHRRIEASDHIGKIVLTVR